MEAAVVDTLLKTNPTLSSLKEKLLQLKKGTYCVHRTWGVGCIQSYDEKNNKVVIIFEGQSEQRQMDPAFVAGKLEILAPSHVIARHRSSPAEVQSMIDSDPAKLFAEILTQATNHTISALEMENTLLLLLGPDFKKWLTSAKKRAAKDTRISFPEKKTDSYVLHAEAVAADDEVLVSFYKTKNVKKKIELAENLLSHQPLPAEVQAKMNSLVEELATAIVDSRILTPGEKLQGVWVRNDLAKIANIDTAKYTLTPQQIIKDAFDLGELAQELPSQYFRRILDLIKETHPDEWQKVSFDLLRSSSGKFTQECVSFLLDNGADKKLSDTLEKWLGEQALKAPLIIWIIKNRAARRYSTMLARLITPKFFSAILYAIDYEAIQNASQKRIALVELLSEDKDLIPELLATANPEVARDLAHTLLMNQGFETLTKRSLLARFIKQFPDIQTLIAAENTTPAQEENLVVSWESLEKRKAEYQDLVANKIPANKEAIAVARELGDLKENSEYKMARQDQTMLMAQKSQIETELRMARGTDFADAPADVVGIGSVVELESKDGKSTQTILGAWDGNPDKNILSYKAPMAQAMMTKKVGTKVKAGGQEYTITGIAKWAGKK